MVEMLTSDLLQTRNEGPYLPTVHQDRCSTVHHDGRRVGRYLRRHEGKTRRELTDALDRYADDSTEYRIQRGLAKLLSDDRCEFIERTIAPSAEIGNVCSLWHEKTIRLFSTLTLSILSPKMISWPKSLANIKPTLNKSRGRCTQT